MKICKINNCNNKVLSNNVCNKHYLRMWRHNSYKKLPTRISKLGILFKGNTPEYWQQYHEIKGYSYKYHKNSLEKKRFTNQRYKARKRNSLGSHTFQQWQDLKIRYNFMCLCCKKFEPVINLTEDHIIPLFYGGSDFISNIQPLCGSCNTKKYIKSTDYRSLSVRSNYRSESLVIQEN